MRTINTLLWGVILLVIASSCSDGKEVDIYPGNFHDAESLTAESMDMPSLHGLVGTLVCTDNYLVVGLLKGEYSFAVFRYPLDGSFFYCGRKGRGPGELIDVDMKSVRAGEGDEVFFFDSKGKQHMTLTDGGSSIVGCDVKPSAHLPKNGILECFDGYVNINVGGSEPDKEYVWSDSKSENLTFFSSYPEWGVPTEDEIPAFVYYKSTMSSPDGHHLAAFYRNFSKCRFFSSISRAPVTIDVHLTGKRYAGIPVPKEKSVAVIYKDETSSEVQVWGWNGRPQGRFLISVPLSFISLSDDGTLLGYCSSNDTFYKCVGVKL